jgi:anti-sigma factor RsiW
MNCRRAKKLIFEYVDGLADERVQLDLERHLGECPECDRMATQLTQSLDLIHRAPQEQLDENFNWKVRLAIHKERVVIRERAASQGSLFRAWNFRYAGSAAAGFAVILVGGWLAINAGLTPVPVSTSLDAAMPRTPDLTQLKSDNDADMRAERQPVAAEEIAASHAAPEKKLKSNDRPARNQPMIGGRSASAGKMVGLGTMSAEEPRPAGAIDNVTSSAAIDSLVRDQLTGMSEADRVIFLERNIQVFRDHLDQCRQKKQP